MNHVTEGKHDADMCPFLGCPDSFPKEDAITETKLLQLPGEEGENLFLARNAGKAVHMLHELAAFVVGTPGYADGQECQEHNPQSLKERE